MVNYQLVQFIQDNLKRGYSYQQIRSYLIQNQWPPQLVDEGIREAYQQSVHHESKEVSDFRHHSKQVAIVAGFTVLLCLVLISIFMLFGGNSSGVSAEELNPEYSISVETPEMEPGQTLRFTNSFTGFEVEGYDIYPIYRVYDANTDKAVMLWNLKEGMGVSEEYTTKKRMSPNMETGRYRLEAQVRFKGSIVSAEDHFVIYKDEKEATCSDGIKNQGEEDIDCGGPCTACPSCDDGIKNQGEEGKDCGGPCDPCGDTCTGDCNDFNACTEDSCQDGVCVNEPIFPCCGNMICEDEENENSCPADCAKTEKSVEFMSETEVMQHAKALLAKSVTSAADFCYSIPDAKKRDKCYRIVAEESGAKRFCAYVNATSSRDSCYMEFAMAYDYSVCKKIKNAYLKKSCEALKNRPPLPKENGE